MKTPHRRLFTKTFASFLLLYSLMAVAHAAVPHQCKRDHAGRDCVYHHKKKDDGKTKFGGTNPGPGCGDYNPFCVAGCILWGMVDAVNGAIHKA